MGIICYNDVRTVEKLRFFAIPNKKGGKKQLSFDSDYNKNLPVSRVKYGKSVIRSIVLLAIEEINGVASLHGKGIKIMVRGNVIELEVFIDVTFGNSCSDVAFRVQENIKDSVETMSVYKLGKIDVHIVGVNFPVKIANVL